MRDFPTAYGSMGYVASRSTMRNHAKTFQSQKQIEWCKCHLHVHLAQKCHACPLLHHPLLNHPYPNKLFRRWLSTTNECIRPQWQLFSPRPPLRPSVKHLLHKETHAYVTSGWFQRKCHTLHGSAKATLNPRLLPPKSMGLTA